MNRSPQNEGRKAQSYTHGMRAAENPRLTRAEADAMFASYTFPVWLMAGQSDDWITYLDGKLYRLSISRSQHLQAFARDPTAAPRKSFYRGDDIGTSQGWRQILQGVIETAYRDEVLAVLWQEEIMQRLDTYLVLDVL